MLNLESYLCRNLTPKQRELIEDFAKEEQGEYDKRAAGASGSNVWYVNQFISSLEKNQCPPPPPFFIFPSNQT